MSKQTVFLNQERFSYSNEFEIRMNPMLNKSKIGQCIVAHTGLMVRVKIKHFLCLFLWWIPLDI